MDSRIPVVLSCCSSAKKKFLNKKKASQRSAARSVNFIMTAVYWQIGRRIVEFEQKGQVPAEYGEKLLEQLAGELSVRFGRGFSYPNLNRFRQFYLTFPLENDLSTPLIESNPPILSTLSRELGLPVEEYRSFST